MLRFNRVELIYTSISAIGVEQIGRTAIIEMTRLRYVHYRLIFIDCIPRIGYIDWMSPLIWMQIFQSETHTRRLWAKCAWNKPYEMKCVQFRRIRDRALSRVNGGKRPTHRLGYNDR